MRDGTEEGAAPVAQGTGMVAVEVTIEWPTGGMAETFEIEEDATAEQIHNAAADVFFNVCNFGWRKKGDA